MKPTLRTVITAALFIMAGALSAQNINCDHIYWMDGDKIFDFDPSTKTYKPYTFNCPTGSSGLAIAPDFRRKEKLTFYTTVSGQMHYFDGSRWVNTNHYVTTVNIAGGGDYMYILDGINSKVYRYDGKGDATLLLDLDETFAGPYDLVCDKKGNFYLMHTKKNKLIQYDPNGKILKDYDLGGLSNQTSGGGFAYRNNVVYANVSGGSMIGEFTNGKIVFTKNTDMPSSMNDFASCPLDVFEPEKDTVPEVKVDPDVIFTDGNVPLKIKDRDVVLQNTITVNATEFEIEIWDQSMPDGDSISLNLNGKWILENYEVVKSKLKLKVKISPTNPNNYLILYALNLGEFSPNTAAVAVLVGGKEYKLTLKSDMKSSGALNFSYKPD
jgi:hypothetical protein